MNPVDDLGDNAKLSVEVFKAYWCGSYLNPAVKRGDFFVFVEKQLGDDMCGRR